MKFKMVFALAGVMVMMVSQLAMAATESGDFPVVGSVAEARSAITAKFASDGYRVSPVVPDYWIKDIGKDCQMTVSVLFVHPPLAKQLTASTTAIVVRCNGRERDLATAALGNVRQALTTH